MSDPLRIPWPENTQTVCVLDCDEVAHRSIKCERFSGGRAKFTTTGLAAKTGKEPCLCLMEVLP